MAGHDRGKGRSHVWWPTRESLEQHARERVDVAPAVHFLVTRSLFGAHVDGCSHHQTGGGEPQHVGSRHRPGDSEVAHDRLAVVQQDVSPFDVTVDEAEAVRVLQRPSHLAGDADRFVHGKPPLTLEAIPEGFALHERHHEEEKIGGLPGLVERQDVGMLQLCRDLDLTRETIRADRCRQLGPEELDRDVATVPEIPGQLDRGHGTLPDLALDRVAVGESSLEAIQRLGHRKSKVSEARWRCED